MGASFVAMLVFTQAATTDTVQAAMLRSPVSAALPSSCTNVVSGLTALTDLGPRTYLGEQGGLYPGGTNAPPAAYLSGGLQAGRAILPLDASGRPMANGRIGFLSIGMSNSTMEFTAFKASEANDPARNRAMVMVDGAQSGVAAVGWTSVSSPAWTVVEQRLSAAAVTDRQVEVIWLKQADVVRQTLGFETYSRTLQSELRQIILIATQRYPSLRQVFVSARTYGGYSGINTVGGGPNPEPWAYETGFADKWLIATSVANPTQRPWVGWGPYFWTDGTKGRADGLQWLCSDTFDHTHPSQSGLAKISVAMHALFIGSALTPWFRT